MAKISAFLGRSFHPDDELVVQKIMKHLNAFKSCGFEYEDAEEAESVSIAEKVKCKIENKDVFIGIFTSRFSFPEKLTKKLNPKKSGWIFPVLYHNLWSTSAWTFQESGYAIAKKQDLILLFEDGIFDKGGLQGDWNFIPFSRKNVEACFSHLSAVINKIIAKRNGATEENKPIEPQTNPPVEESKVSREEKTDEKKDYGTSIVEHLLHKDQTKAEEVLSEWVNQTSESNEQIDRKSTYQFYKAMIGGYPDTLVELEKLSQENPKNYLSKNHLARAYEEMQQYERAAPLFLEASALARTGREQMSNAVNSARNVAKSGKSDEAIQFLEKKLKNISDEKLQSQIFEGLADIYKELKHDEKESSCLEKTVFLDPSNHSLRFRLAYKYGELRKKSAQSLYHYNILSQAAPDPANLNNLGVAYSELDLKVNAVWAYKKSAELNNTLAMSNLAYKLISSGFTDEAKQYIEKARQQSQNVHSNISSADVKISETIDAETKKKEEALRNTKQERDFRLAFADALSQEKQPHNLTGKWKTVHGELDISFVEGSAYAKNTVPAPSYLSLYSAILGQGSTMPDRFKDVMLTAVIHNSSMSGKIRIQYDENPSGRATLLSDKSTEDQILGIIKSDSLIEIMQTNSDGKIEFFNFQKIATPA